VNEGLLCSYEICIIMDNLSMSY